MSARLLIFFASALLIGSINAMEIKFKDCGSQVGKIHSVAIEPCTSFPCQLKRGQSYSITVDFTSAEDTDVLHSKIMAKAFGFNVPFTLPNADGCKDSGIECPVRKGQRYQFKASLPILAIYPRISVLVSWSLYDHEVNGNKLFCFATPLKVV